MPWFLWATWAALDVDARLLTAKVLAMKEMGCESPGVSVPRGWRPAVPTTQVTRCGGTRRPPNFGNAR